MTRIYLDYAATTPVDERVIEEMLPYFKDDFGNPSSLHSFGRYARQKVEEAREKVANLIGAKVSEIIFTSGGTEANNFALIGIALTNKNRGGHIITSSVEHHCILETTHFLQSEGFDITYLPVDKFGIVAPEEVKKAITKKTILISIMHANNEIGTLQNIAEISKIAKDMEIYFHCDAVQTAGNLDFKVDDLRVDLLCLSSHKLYGPKGVGALYIRDKVKIKPIIYGGAQERKRRAGTENVPGMVGFGKACEIAKEEMSQRVSHNLHLREKLIKGIMNNIEDISLNGHPTFRLPNNVNFSFKYIEGEAILLNLDLKGIAASSGSACSSGSISPSHVLSAIGLPRDMSNGSIRFTVGKDTTEDDIDYTVQTLKGIVQRLREISPIRR